MGAERGGRSAGAEEGGRACGVEAAEVHAMPMVEVLLRADVLQRVHGGGGEGSVRALVVKNTKRHDKLTSEMNK